MNLLEQKTFSFLGGFMSGTALLRRVHALPVETRADRQFPTHAGSAWWFNPYTVTAAAAAYPQIPKQLTWQGIPFAPWKNLYQAYVAPLGSPSTGWIGEFRDFGDLLDAAPHARMPNTPLRCLGHTRKATRNVSEV